MVRPILFYAEFSPEARAVLQTLKVLKVDVELRLFDYARKENITEEFINPRHTVPTLIDDGDAFYDGHAIITYLASKYAANDQLYPSDLVLRAKVDSRLFLNAGVLLPLIRSMVAPIIYDRALAIDPKLVQQTHRIYEQLETYLVRQYLVGNSMTVADIACASTVLTLCYLVPIDAELYPRIDIWLMLMTKLPDYDEVQCAGAKLLSSGLNRYIELNLRRKADEEEPQSMGKFRRRAKERGMLKND